MADYYANSENYAYWAKHIFPASEAARREKIHKPWLERVVGATASASACRAARWSRSGRASARSRRSPATSGAFDRVIAVEPTPEMAAACRARGVEVVEKRIEDVGRELPRGERGLRLRGDRASVRAGALRRGRARAAGARAACWCCRVRTAQGFDIATLGAGSLAVDAEHVNLFNPGSLAPPGRGAPASRCSRCTRPAASTPSSCARRRCKGEIDLSADPFLQRVLIDEWDRLGWPFQQFLAEQGLSSHMWLAAQRHA